MAFDGALYRRRLHYAWFNLCYNGYLLGVAVFRWRLRLFYFTVSVTALKFLAGLWHS